MNKTQTLYRRWTRTSLDGVFIDASVLTTMIVGFVQGSVTVVG
jgi:hypothetical protein